MIHEWMAFERLEPFGWPIVESLYEWGRAALSLILTAFSGSAFDVDQTPKISMADVPTEEDPEDPLDAADAEEPLSWSEDQEVPTAAGPTSEDILRDLREQQMFM